MSQEKIKTPTKSGREEASRRLKELRKKEPSSGLVKIIEEVTRDESDQKPEVDSNDIAAKPHGEPKRDLDL